LVGSAGFAGGAAVGVAAGVGTGLTPGIHVNNVALLVYVGQSALSGAIVLVFGWASPSGGDIALMLSTLILAMAVSHTFISFAPSVFLGAPAKAPFRSTTCSSSAPRDCQ
jgi:TctA family transporter